MTPTQFKAYGFGVFPTPMQSIVIDTEAGVGIHAYFKDESAYKATLEFTLQNLRPSNRRQVLFVIPGGKR